MLERASATLFAQLESLIFPGRRLFLQKFGVAHSMQTARVLLGDCKEHLKSLESDSIDSLVTDPPAGISFMNKAWDSYESLHHFQDDLTVIFKEALRVLKPGAHGLVWALPRTSHHTAMSLERAGFEVRDSILHLFSKGMPVSHNVALAGAGPAWEGWNIALKPGHEVWWLVRKPLAEKTLAKQILATGTGCLNIDGCRIPMPDRDAYEAKRRSFSGSAGKKTNGWKHNSPVLSAEAHIANSHLGRWPANTLLSHECDVECSDDCVVPALGQPEEDASASRFFYTHKVSQAERRLPDGSVNTHPTAKSAKLMRYLAKLITPPKGTVLDPFTGSGTTGVAALKEGFSFIGMELDPEHHRVATLRLETEQQDRSSLVSEMFADENDP